MGSESPAGRGVEDGGQELAWVCIPLLRAPPTRCSHGEAERPGGSAKGFRQTNLQSTQGTPHLGAPRPWPRRGSPVTLRSPLSPQLPCPGSLLGSPPSHTPTWAYRLLRPNPPGPQSASTPGTLIPHPSASFSALDLGSSGRSWDSPLPGGSLLFTGRNQGLESVAGRSGSRGWILPGYNWARIPRSYCAQPPDSQADGAAPRGAGQAVRRLPVEDDAPG